MAITRPVTRTIISTTAWGVPITDQVNADADWIASQKPTAWIPLALQNGATATIASSYRKVGDMVQLRGTVQTTAGSTGAPAFAVLPASYRPPIALDFSVVYYSSSRIAGAFVIWTDGRICLYDTPGQAPLTGLLFSVTP